MLERGEVASVNELAEQQGVDPSLIGRTLRLATLAPDITQPAQSQRMHGSKLILIWISPGFRSGE